MFDEDDVWLVIRPRLDVRSPMVFSDESGDFDAAAFIRVTQNLVEVVRGASSDIHVSQITVEAVHGASSFVHISQSIIEVVRTIPINIYVTQMVIEVVVKTPAICACVASPGISICVHGNALVYSDCSAGVPTTFGDQLVGIPIPCP